MLRLALLVYLLAAPFSLDIGGGWDPNGSAATGDLHGNLDPNGMTAQSPGDLHGNLDPNG